MNLTGILQIFDQLPSYGKLVEELDTGKLLGPQGLIPGAKEPLLANLILSLRRPILFLTGRVDAVPEWQQALEAWLPDNCRPKRFPEPTPLPFERGPWSDLSRNLRLAVLANLMAGQHPLIPGDDSRPLLLASARAILQKTLPRRKFVSATRLLRVGQLLDLDKLAKDWLSAGYVQVPVVEAPGQFSRRGGIIDIFSVGSTHPARIELFGEEIESLRSFDPATQRSGGVSSQPIDHIVIPPAREVLPGDAILLGKQLAKILSFDATGQADWKDDIPALAAGEPLSCLEYYLPMIYKQPASLLSYLPESAIIVIDDMAELIIAFKEIQSHADQVANEREDRPSGFQTPLLDWSHLLEEIKSRPHLILGDDGPGGNLEAAQLGSVFQPGPRYGGQMRPFLLQLRSGIVHGERTIVVSRQAHRLAELWREDNVNKSFITDQKPVDSLANLPAEGSVTIVQGSLAGGFSIEQPAREKSLKTKGDSTLLLNLLTDAEIFGWNRPVPRRRLVPRPIAPETFYADLSPDDYVVHLEFGVGRFGGLVVRSVGSVDREYLQVSYAKGDVLYVPVHHADRLSKWIGPDDRSPVLHRLGEKAWKRARAKVQEAVDLLADELLDLYAARETIPGHAFASDSHWQAELEASFPHRETQDQLQALSEVKADMERPYPMDRLVCGDVGYGKTEVALRAAFKAVMDGKQVAILVPTTVLAQQHYRTFTQRLSPFPVNLDMLSRFRTQTRQNKIIRMIREGQVDIVIGTHRLLSDDVSFKDLGLLIIDEEQRFGVGHKEKIKHLRTEVDVLTMTATPIPRTLYMSMTGVRDISLIDTAPADRLPVQTYVGESDDTLLRRAVLREMDRGGQVFFVHNRVQTIETAYLKLSRLVPEARIAIGHGQLGERDLEEAMLRFINGEIDVLLSTTIIESGLDIPNANTLIVERADQFGLAQLYQLRGRVGRGNRRAYAYFLHPNWRRLTAEAKARLEVIAGQTELGAGYTIALRDLEIRGAGDLLGSRQSGHISAVGFDLYTRLLAQAVKRRRSSRKGEKVSLELPEAVLIELPLAAYVPTDYVPDAGLRLRLYRRMAVLGSLAEIDEMATELADRFGPIPDPVDNLLYQLRIKVIARNAGVPSVTTESGQVQIKLPEGNGIDRLGLQRFMKMDVRVSRKGIWLGRELTTREWQVALVQALERLRELKGRNMLPGSIS